MPKNTELLLINKDIVEQILNPDEVVGAVREAFELHFRNEGRVFPVIREGLATGGIFGIKAGDVAHQDLLGFKAAGFWPSNRALDGEPHQATILLIDPQTGRPLCVIDGNMITTMRTGAAGALGLRTLARQNSETLTVFGAGVQAVSQLTYALYSLPSIRKVQYVSVDRKPSPAFEAHFAQHYDIKCASDPNAAVASSDIVITATPGGAPLFDEHAVRAGTHLNCVGADTRGKRELPDGLLSRVRLFVDDKQQASGLGELQWSPCVPCQELGEILVEQSFVRQESDITVFDMTGLALQDLTVARMIYEKARDEGLGNKAAWPW